MWIEICGFFLFASNIVILLHKNESNIPLWKALIKGFISSYTYNFRPIYEDCMTKQTKHFTICLFSLIFGFQSDLLLTINAFQKS